MGLCIQKKLTVLHYLYMVTLKSHSNVLQNRRDQVITSQMKMLGLLAQ